MFSLAIGGYGLFGIIASVSLRLAPRVKMRRDVTLLQLDQLIPAFDARIAVATPTATSSSPSIRPAPTSCSAACSRAICRWTRPRP
ncbi:hypothetical protein LP419_32640 [Massilia sp. H-1]|nr:hypothetical protein LP419_32640 [Massilia sp. H-1]